MKKKIFEQYAKAVADTFGIEEDLLYTRDIVREVWEPRKMLYYLCVKRNMGFSEVASYMKNKGANTLHSSVHRAYHRMDHKVKTDRDYYLLSKQIESCIQ